MRGNVRFWVYRVVRGYPLVIGEWGRYGVISIVLTLREKWEMMGGYSDGLCW